MAGMMARVLMTKSAGLYPPLKGGNGNGPRRRKRKAKAARKVHRVKKRNGSRKAGRLVKGSAAAKAYMAKIRRKRRR